MTNTVNDGAGPPEETDFGSFLNSKDEDLGISEVEKPEISLDEIRRSGDNSGFSRPVGQSKPKATVAPISKPAAPEKEFGLTPRLRKQHSKRLPAFQVRAAPESRDKLRQIAHAKGWEIGFTFEAAVEALAEKLGERGRA